MRLSPAEARLFLGTVGLGRVPMLGRPALLCRGAPSRSRPAHRSRQWPATARPGPRTRWRGHRGHRPDARQRRGAAHRPAAASRWPAMAADRPAFTLPVDDGKSPDYAAVCRRVRRRACRSAAGLAPERDLALELRIETVAHRMPRS